MKTEIISGYLLECGHLDWMTDVQQHPKIDSSELEFRWHKKEWFIAESENLTEKIQQIILAEMESIREINQKTKPRINWLSTWVKSEFPSTVRIAVDIHKMVKSNDFVGCVYSGPGGKNTKGFILTRAVMVEEDIFILTSVKEE